MKQATARLYIRFGELPKDGKSRVHISGEPCVEEAGVSVYRAIEANGVYYPELPEESNAAGISDYFRYLMESDSPVYLVTGDLLWLEGHDREPLLANPVVVADLTHFYRRWIRSQADTTNQQEAKP